MTSMTRYEPDQPGVEIAVRELAAGHPYPLLFASVCGSRLFGFDTPRSDRDVRGAHVIPLELALGLDEPDPSIVRLNEGARSMEISTHEVRKYFGMLLNRNGNVLEEVLSPLVVVAGPAHRELQDITAGCVTRRHAGHYAGLARRAMNMLGREERPGIKYGLHMHRALLTGIRLMRTGELEPHLPTLNREAGLEHVDSLLARRRNEKAPGVMGQREVQRCRLAGEQLMGQLELAADRSGLPREPAGRAALNNLLIRLRCGARGRRFSGPARGHTAVQGPGRLL